MLREANLSNKKFTLLPVVGDMVLITAPISVLDDGAVKNSSSKIMRRLKNSEEDGVDFSGMLKTMEKDDIEAFLKEKSKKIESGMIDVIAQVHGAGPKTSPQVSATPKLSSVRTPSPRI